MIVSAWPHWPNEKYLFTVSLFPVEYINLVAGQADTTHPFLLLPLTTSCSSISYLLFDGIHHFHVQNLDFSRSKININPTNPLQCPLGLSNDLPYKFDAHFALIWTAVHTVPIKIMKLPAWNRIFAGFRAVLSGGTWVSFLLSCLPSLLKILTQGTSPPPHPPPTLSRECHRMCPDYYCIA